MRKRLKVCLRGLRVLILLKTKKAGGKIDSAFNDNLVFCLHGSPFAADNAFDFFFICPVSLVSGQRLF